MHQSCIRCSCRIITQNNKHKTKKKKTSPFTCSKSKNRNNSQWTYLVSCWFTKAMILLYFDKKYQKHGFFFRQIKRTKKLVFFFPHKPKVTRNVISTLKTTAKKWKTQFLTPQQTKRLKKRCFREQNTPNVKENQEILLYSLSW